MVGTAALHSRGVCDTSHNEGRQEGPTVQPSHLPPYSQCQWVHTLLKFSVFPVDRFYYKQPVWAVERQNWHQGTLAAWVERLGGLGEVFPGSRGVHTLSGDDFGSLFNCFRRFWSAKENTESLSERKALLESQKMNFSLFCCKFISREKKRLNEASLIAKWKAVLLKPGVVPLRYSEPMINVICAVLVGYSA